MVRLLWRIERTLYFLSIRIKKYGWMPSDLAAGVVINEISILPLKQKRRSFRQFAKSAFRWQATAHFYLIRRKFSKLAFSEQEKVFIKAQKIRPTKSKIFVGLILMPPHPIGIAFSGKSWYTASKNNVDNCRAFCRCDQRNADFVFYDTNLSLSNCRACSAPLTAK